MKYILGVDLGTTAIKIGLFDEEGAAVAVSTNEYSLITPSAAMVELEVETYWQAFAAGVKEVLTQSGAAPGDILALGISAQSETLLVVDEAGQPLRNAIVWMDNRATEEAEELLALLGIEKIHKASGQTDMLGIWPASKILWLRKHEPEVYKKVHKYLLIEDYFLYRLCGKYCGEGSLWSTTIMWDITTRKYWPEMLAALGVDEGQLPEMLESTTDIGGIAPAVAAELGLDPATRLVMGGLDQACGAIGIGNVREGVMSESTGGALAVSAMVEKPLFDEKRQIPCLYSCIPGMYMLHAFTSGGIAYQWLRDALCSEEVSVAQRGEMGAYFLMDKQAQSVPAGSEGLVVLPYFQGAGSPDMDQYAKCAVYGLSLHHTKAHIIRAFLEGVAISLTRIVEALEALGLPVGEIRALSGGAKSKLWCQIKADATGKRVVTMSNTDDAACLGAAILAGVGVGLWPSVPQAAERFAARKDEYPPQAENRAAYADLLARYKLLTSTLKPAYPSL